MVARLRPLLEPLPPRFPPALRAARQRRGLSQHELSDLLAAAGLAAPVWLISAWENGHREPCRDEAWILADVLHLHEATLLLRLRGTTPEARDLYARFSADSLLYVTPVVLEHLHIGPAGPAGPFGPVERVEVARRIRALLQPVASIYVVHAEDDDRHRVRIETGPGCRIGNRRPLMKGRVEVRLDLDEELAADEERDVEYALRHTYFGPPTPADLGHRHNVTHLHTLIGMTATFPEPGAVVRWYTGRGRDRPEEVEGPIRLHGESGSREWRYPGEVSCGIGWEARA